MMAIEPGIESLRLLSGPEFATGSEVVVSMHEITDIMHRQRLDGSHALVITAPLDAEWLEEAKPGRVVRMDDGSAVTEWWVSRDGVSLGEGSELVNMACDPLHTILADVGMIEVTRDLFRITNLGGVGLSARNYIATFIVPFLEEHGIDCRPPCGGAD
jgi:hypothetical protein